MTTTLDPRVTQRADKIRADLESLRDQLKARRQSAPPKTDGPAKVHPSAVTDVQPAPSVPNRPKSLDEMVGQVEILTRLRTVIHGSQMRGERMAHTLISGPPGVGKTSVSEVIAGELGVPMVSTTGMLLKRPQDITGLVMKLEGPALLFIDEVHACSKLAIEATYSLLEDGRIDLLGGSGPDTIATTQYLPHLVIVAATTQLGKLSQPFRDRYGLSLVMDVYSDEDIAEIVNRYWKSRGVKHFKGESLGIAQRSRGVPRNAVRLAQRVMDYAAVCDHPETVTSGTVADASELFGIDPTGLDATDRKVLTALTTDFVGRSVGLDVLSSHCDLDARTMTETVEPYLSRRGLLIRTGRGRVATAAAYELMRRES